MSQLHGIENERVVLGSILLRGNKPLEAAMNAAIEPSHFYDERHRIIYRTFIALAGAGISIDAISVKRALQNNKQLEAVGVVYLAGLTEGIPLNVDVGHYAAEIAELSGKRRLLSSAANLQAAATSGNGDMDAAIADIRKQANSIGQQRKVTHAFKQIAEDRFSLTVAEIATTLEVDRLRRDGHELIGELSVSCELPGIPTYDGNLSIADFNLSSARARSERARLLSARSNAKELDWSAYLEELCQRVLAAERNGQPAVDLRDLPKPNTDDTLSIEGIRLPRRHPTIFFGDGGAAKSYTGLYLAGCLAEQGFKLALFDWELAGEDHRDRLERLFGNAMPRISYVRCERPLAYEVDRLKRIVRDEKIDYAVYDSVAFACDGPPESAEIAGRYFRAVRQIGTGSLHIAHITKGEGGDTKPFGSVFWHNGARSTWFAKLADESPNGQVLQLGLFNKKSNLGRLHLPTGFRITFTEERTHFERSNPADNPDLASRMTVRERMVHLLGSGALSYEEIASEIDAEPETIRRTVRRHKSTFTILQGGKVALLQRVS